MDDNALFPAPPRPPRAPAPARFHVTLEVPLPRDGTLIVPCFVQDAIAYGTLSCPDLTGTCTAEMVQLWADIGEERVPSMSAMAWAVARQACGTTAMRSARLAVEPVTVTAV